MLSKLRYDPFYSDTDSSSSSSEFDIRTPPPSLTPALISNELKRVNKNVMALYDKQKKLKMQLESAEQYEKECTNRDHDAVLAVDISASTRKFDPYYVRVKTIYDTYKPTLTLVWDSSCLFAANLASVAALRKRGGGTEAECLLKFIDGLAEYKIKRLIIVTDAQFGRVSVPEIDRLNYVYPLKNVETMTLFFVGNPKNMTTSIENMFYRPHMTSLQKGDDPEKNLINVYPRKPLSDTDDLFSDEVLNRVVYAAKNYGPSDLEKFRASLLSLVEVTRCKNEFLETEREFASLCASKDVEKCKKLVDEKGRSDSRQKDCDSQSSFLLRLLESRKNLYCASYLRGKYVPHSEYLHEETTTFKEVDPVTLEGCEGALTLFLISRHDDLSNVENNPLKYMKKHCGERVEKQLYSYKTYARLKDSVKFSNVTSPTTRRNVCGTFVLDFYNAYKHNSYNLAMFVNGVPKLHGMHGLWHVAFCYFLSKEESFSPEVKSELQKYARRAAYATKCRAALDNYIYPRWKCSVVDALWYVVNVASLYESGCMNVCRSYPDVDFCDLYAYCCGDASVSEETKRKHALYRTKSKVYSVMCKGKEEARKEAYKSGVGGATLQNHGVLVCSAGDHLDESVISELAHLINGKPTSKYFKHGKARVHYGGIIDKDWEEIVNHVSFDRETCRHSKLCKITGKPWIDCWQDNRYKSPTRCSLFEVLFGFVKKRKRYPSDEYELARYHQKTRMNDYDEVVYSSENIRAFAKVIDIVKEQLKDLSCKEICERRARKL